MKEIIEQYGDVLTALTGLAATLLLLGACWTVYQAQLLDLFESILVS